MLQRNNLKKELMEQTLPRAIDDYMTALTLEGKSPKTILWYRKKLTRFATFMQDGGTPAKVCSLTLDDGRSFLKSLPKTTSLQESSRLMRHRCTPSL